MGRAARNRRGQVAPSGWGKGGERPRRAGGPGGRVVWGNVVVASSGGFPELATVVEVRLRMGGLVIRVFEGTAEFRGSAPRVYHPALGAGLEPAGPAKRAHPA